MLLAGVCVLATLATADTAEARTIRWKYTSSHSLTVNPLYEFYTDNVGFDLNGYAREYAVLRGASRSSVRVYLSARNAYGWKFKYYVPRHRRWYTRGFNMLDVARWQGRKKFGSRVKNYGVYFRWFSNPYSWKGAYIVRIR